LVKHAFELAGVKGDPMDRIEVDPSFLPSGLLSSGCEKAHKELCWNPEHNAENVVKMLVEHYERKVDAI